MKKRLWNCFVLWVQVCSLLMDSTWTVVVDPEERTPYAYKEDQWIGFDDLDSIVKKVSNVAT